MIAADVYAQVGTFKVCPWGASDYAEILQAVADGLLSAGANERQMRDYTVEVAGLFISSVVAGVYGIRGPDPATFRRGALIGKFVHPAIGGTTMTRAVAIWSDVQMRLWGDDEGLCRAARPYQPPQLDTISFEAIRGVAILLDSYDHAEMCEDGLVWSDPRLARLAADELQFRYSAWPIKAFQLAELLFPYVMADKEYASPPPPAEDNRRQAGSGERPSQDARSRRQQLTRVPIDLGEILSRDWAQVAE